MDRVGTLEIVERYLVSISTSVAPETLRTNGYKLKPYARAVADFPDTPAAVVSYLVRRREAVSGVTYRGDWTALRTFHRWCASALHMTDPMATMRAPRLPQTVPDPLSRDQVSRIGSAVRTLHEEIAVLALCGSGLRIGELQRLRPCDVRDGVIYVTSQGKTGARPVPCDPRLPSLLAALDPGAPVFGYSRSGLTKFWRRLTARAGIHGRQGGPHAARHYFGTEYYRRTKDLHRTQRTMGHRDPRTTQIYVTLDISDYLDGWSRDCPTAGVVQGYSLPLFPPTSYAPTLSTPQVTHAQPALAPALPARQVVLDCLRDRGLPMTPAEVARCSGRTAGATRKLLWQMAGEGSLVSDGGRYALDRAWFDVSAKVVSFAAPSRPRRVRVQNAEKTHCPAGHEYAGENLYHNPRGFRVCRECTRAIQRRQKARRAAG